MKELNKILRAIKDAGGQSLIVGGAVRDQLLGLDSKDLDIECYGIQPDKLVEVLNKFGHVDSVGRSFGILKMRINGLDLDFSIPRRDSKEGKGHRGFLAELDPSMTPKEAAARRDFTINSLAMDPDLESGREDGLEGPILDFYGGQDDLKAQSLHHTSVQFSEDPLRVLRGFQFAARFDMTMAQDTADLCRTMLPEACDLPVERVWEEWKKWALKGKTPSMGLDILLQTGWIDLYPELKALINCPQDPIWHPERWDRSEPYHNVWVHTCHVTDWAAHVAARDNLNEFDRLVLVFAALTHDVGKALTTTKDADGRIRSKAHSAAGEDLTRAFLTRIGCPEEIIRHTLPIVKEHLWHIAQDVNNIRGLKRLAVRISPSSISQWGRVVECDHSGRPPLPPGNPSAPFVEAARALQIENEKPAAILMGRHLIDLGLTPGPAFGKILSTAFDSQLDGEFDDLESALFWLKAFLAKQ